MSKARITVTIEETLVQEIDRAAKTLKQNRSSLLETAVRTWKKVRQEQQLMEGYQALAEENLKVAEANLPAGYEALK